MKDRISRETETAMVGKAGIPSAIGETTAWNTESGDPHIDGQVQAIRRIYETLYPDRGIRYIFKALPGVVGAPDRVEIRHHTQDSPLLPAGVQQLHPHLDFSYLGSLETGVDAGLPPDTEIIVAIPARADPDSLHDDKTAPAFEQRAVQFMVWKTPVVFEQLKYRYEQRQKRERELHHRHVPLERATRSPLGPRPMILDEMKRPAILIGFHWLEVGGAEKLGLDCVQWALDAGFRVLVVADKPAGQRLSSRLPVHDDVEFIRTDAYLPHHLWFEFLVALVQRENIQAIHIHHHIRLYENLATLKALFPDMQVIDSTHIIEHADGGYPRVSGVWSPYIDHHHVISHELVNYFLDVFNLSEKVRLGRMLPRPGEDAPPAPRDFRLRAGQKSLRLIFVGRMVHQKRAPLAIAIADRIARWARRQGIAVHLDMVGTGPYLDVARHMARRRRLVNRVTFHAPDANVPELFEKADVLLLPSSNEGLALVCYEAIQKGVIPISTRVGGQDELLPDELLVSPSPSACIRQSARIVQRLLSDANLVTRCTDALKRKYRAIGQDPTAHEVIGEIYRNILDRASAK